MNDLEELAKRFGVIRNHRMAVPCSGCGIGCHPVEPLGCFCIRCYAAQRQSKADP